METNIAAMSMSNSLSSLQSSINMVMLRKTMNQDAQSVANLLQSMPATPPPVPAGAVGSLMDIRG